MANISIVKITTEINDILLHRSYVMRSGEYLANYLIFHERSVDALRLIGRCCIHDISKIQNTKEFLLLASISDNMGYMQDINHELSDIEREAICEHWKHNSHHPEYYQDPNDMSELDIMEMACDCHARSKQFKTNLLEYLEAQQRIRFHFDENHYRMLKRYATILVEQTKDDDYHKIGEIQIPHQFNFKDSTLKMLEHFDDSTYKNEYKTERLTLSKVNHSDFATIVYKVLIDSTPIGYIAIKGNGYIDCNIYREYIGYGYTYEALSKMVGETPLSALLYQINKGFNEPHETLNALGFDKIKETDCTETYKLIKKND